ncbi:uncharacterized protein LOC123661102 [Melitaea cinxia]|uniref:uncharacterized protein LOC123661102 n=1 Tax=Melitaea cinxia TaxID=113334 RepID=UPI001E26FF86|nr:uncharacterized protein LOC123661102 [Melitaea cinxia]
MGLPHITSFCWCLGLEAGTKLIGYVHLILSFALMVVSALYAESLRALAGTVEDAEDHLYSTWYKISIGVAVFTVVHVLLAATLLYAVFARNTVALRGWVYVMIVLYIVSLIYVIVSMTFGFSASGSHIFLSFLEGVVFFGILAYCILCVNSYYLMLKSAEDMEGPNKNSRSGV